MNPKLKNYLQKLSPSVAGQPMLDDLCKEMERLFRKSPTALDGGRNLQLNCELPHRSHLNPNRKGRTRSSTEAA